MITHNVTSAELRAKGIWCVTSEEYESGKKFTVKDNSSMVTRVYDGALMELELQLAYNGNDKKRYQRAINNIRKEMNSVTSEGIHIE